MRTTIALLAVATAALTGCGMLPQAQAGGGQEKQAVETTTAPAPVEEKVEDNAEVPTEELQAIASRKVSHDGTSLRVDITSLKRQGKIATLTWTLTNLDEGPGSWYVGTKLGSRTLDWTVSGVTLIDPVNGKRYRVARNGTDEEAKCVCSRVNEHIKSGDALEMYAVYGAPPADVTKVNVELPDLGVFTDVSIS